MVRLLRFLIGVEVIRSPWMAYVLTWSVAHACMLMGADYVHRYPGWIGWLIFAAASLTAMLVGVNLLELAKRAPGTVPPSPRRTSPGKAR